MSVSPSVSVADTAVPILTPEPVFSVMERVVLSPSENTGALFDGVSSTSVTIIVTEILSVPSLPSDTMIVTEYDDFVS